MAATYYCKDCKTVVQVDEDMACENCGRILSEEDEQTLTDACAGCDCDCGSECDNGE